MAVFPKVPLREICDSVEYGYTASASTDPIGPKFLRITDIVPESINWEDVPFCHIEPKKLRKHRLETGDIVVARTGATTGWAKFIEHPPDAVFASYLVRLRPSPRVDARFVGFVVESSDYKSFIQQHMGGSAQPNANAQILTSYPILLPPLQVQQRFADILSEYHRLIENCQRRIGILEAMARALYQEWFVSFRFPECGDRQLRNSPLGKIPDGWELKSVSQVADVNHEQINKHTAPEKLQYIDISSVSRDSIDSMSTYSFADAPSRARRIVKHGDVLWSCVRPNRRSHALVMHPAPNTIASTGFAVLRAKAVPFTFLYSATTTDEFVSHLVNNATGSAYPAVSASTFEEVKLVVPPLHLLERFDALASPIAETTHILRQQIHNLRQTRDLMLPSLLTGEITL